MVMRKSSTKRIRLSSDPLEAFGPSLFLHVLSALEYPDLLTIPQISKSWHALCLSHRTGIWRPACARAGAETPASLSATGSSALPDLHSDRRSQGQGLAAVDWKDRCRRHVLLDRNWRFGRCRDQWITGGGNAVWRFKIDEEQGTCLMTSRLGGLHVVDAKTSQPLFSMRSVRPYAHLEFCKGYAIFDIGSVYRTASAISRSSIQKPASGRLPREALSSISHTHSSWRPRQLMPSSAVNDDENGNRLEPPPRGHLEYYRKIAPPTACRAFRARADRAGTEGERAMLATAGERGVHIWDLEDESRPAEIVSIPEEEEDIDIQYVEFDDDYIFLCGHAKLHVFCRRTKKRLLAYPPIPTLMERMCAMTCHIDLNDPDVVRVVDRSLHRSNDTGPTADADPTGSDGSAVVGRADSILAESSDMEFAIVMAQGCVASEMDDTEELSYHPLWPPRDYNYSACHYTATDLVCATKLGQLLITRNYAEVFEIADEAERIEQWGKHTLAMGFGEPIMLLAVDRTHITVNTPEHIIFLDTSTLPTLPRAPSVPVDPTMRTVGAMQADPLPAGTTPTQPEVTSSADTATSALSPPPSIRVHSILSTHPYGIHESSCAQITRTGIYYTYFALGDMQGGTDGVVRGTIQGPQVPERAAEQFGICIRAWDFGLNEDGA